MVGAKAEAHVLTMVQIGGTHSTRPGPDDAKTLKQLNFQVMHAAVAALGLVLVHASATVQHASFTVVLWYCRAQDSPVLAVVCCRRETSWMSVSCDTAACFRVTSEQCPVLSSGWMHFMQLVYALQILAGYHAMMHVKYLQA